MIPSAEHTTTQVEVLRFAGHWLSKQGELDRDVAAEYSRMKYGDPLAARAIAHKMAKKLTSSSEFLALLKRTGNAEIAISCSAYGSIPPSAAGLMAEMCSPLNKAGLQLFPFKIERQGGFSRMDYDALDHAAREKVVQARRLHIAPQDLAMLNNKVVLLIDDLRSTGAHERALIKLLTQTSGIRAIVCLYWIGFAAPLDQQGPEHESRINHALISQLDHLAPAFLQAAVPPRLNARVLKFILRGGRDGLGDRQAFFQQLPAETALRLYEAALSPDGYFNRPQFREGFELLENFLLSKRIIPARRSLRLRNLHEQKVVLHNLHTTPAGEFRCAETDADFSDLIRQYSRFKFGGVPEIRSFGRALADHLIAEIAAGHGPAKALHAAQQSGGYVYLVAPGIRNVVSASNYLLRVVATRVNVWLSQQQLPTLIVKPISRLGSGRANYAELSANARKTRKKSTRSVIPQREFADYPIHVIFLDDVEVTGTTANRAREKYLAAGAQSFQAVFALRVVPEVAADWAGIEHAMNQYAIAGGLDAQVAELLVHPDYQPVQRMLRLLFHPDNREQLAVFASGLPPHSLLRIYQGAMANDYLWINGEVPGKLGLYGPSLRIWQGVMQDKRLLDTKGLPF